MSSPVDKDSDTTEAEEASSVTLSEDDEKEDSALALGLRFLYENYSDRCWFWEAIDLFRKVILTSGSVLFGYQSRWAVGITAMISGKSGPVHINLG